MGMLLKATYVRPAKCGVQQLREPGWALLVSSSKDIAEIFSCSFGVAARKCPANVLVTPYSRARMAWHAILQMEVRTVCCRRPRRLYASRYCELKRFGGSSGGCSRAAEGRFLKQFRNLN